MHDLSPQSNTVAIQDAQPIPPCMYAQPPPSSPNLLEAAAPLARASMLGKNLHVCQPAENHVSSFSMNPEGYKDTLLLAQRVGKKITLLKNIMDFPVPTIQRRVLVAALLRNPHAVKVMSSLSACALWRSCYVLLSGIGARTGHSHQPLYSLPPLGVPQLQGCEGKFPDIRLLDFMTTFSLWEAKSRPFECFGLAELLMEPMSHPGTWQ